MTRPLPPGVFGHASFETFDGVRTGRIRLDRWWDATLEVDFGRPSDDRYRPLVVIGANPSKADGEGDDNTIFKVYKYARREGANGLVMVNLDTRIATDATDIEQIRLPYGATERAWEAIDEALCEDCVAVLVGWGKVLDHLDDHRDRVAKLKHIASDVGRALVCLKKNKDGSPAHPLYQRDAAPFVPWWSP